MSNIIRFTDIWGGNNYGCYPIKTGGKELKERLDRSELWELLKAEEHYDERNDNQCDIHRGGDFSYKHCTTGNIVDVFMTKSRSGKTVNWEFHCSFDGGIFNQ